MRYRVLGRTGWQVSVLGLGAAAFGQVYGPVEQSEVDRAVRAALALGINFLDVSPYYGATAAEAALGTALRGLPRDRYFLATKCGRYDVDRFDFSPRRIRGSLTESLRRLQVDHVDLYQLHDVEFADPDRIHGESVPELIRLREEGLVRAVGITGLPLTPFRRVLETPIDSILSYCRYCLLDDRLVTILPALKARGIGVIHASPTAMGLLTSTGPPDWHPAPAELRAACRRAAELCSTRGTDLAELALQFSAGHPDIATTLTGARSSDELSRNAAALERPIDQELLESVQRVLAPVHNRLWRSGRPENNP